MPKEYIEREAALDSSNIITVQTREYGSIEVIPVDCIADIPSADVAPVVHGRWVEIEDFDGDSHWKCSVCGCEWYFETGGPVENGSNYCPNCGAKMDGEKR